MLDRIRRKFRKGGKRAVWLFCMAARGPCGKAKRFDAAAVWARKKRNQQKKDSAEWKEWEDARRQYHRAYVEYHEKCEDRNEPAWPDDITFVEFLYHLNHLHIASTQREKLIQICKIAEARGIRVGEFPPFDPVENVHAVCSSWHYRDSANPWTARCFSNRGDGLAADLNDADGGSDKEQAFRDELTRRYR